MAETCSEYVSNGFALLVRCPRAVKADGLCGPHLAGKQRRNKTHAKYEEKRRRSEAAKAEGIATLEALHIKGEPYYDTLRTQGMGEYRRAVVIDIDELRRWAAAKEAK